MSDLQLEQYIAAHNKQAELIDKLKQELEEYRSIAEKVGAAKAVSEKEQWEKCADHMYYYTLTYPIEIDYPQGRIDRDKVVEEYKKLKGLL